MVEMEDDAEDVPTHSHGQVLPPSPTPTPEPFFVDRGSSAAVTYATLTSGRRADERQAAIISQLMYVEERNNQRLEDRASADSIELKANATVIADLREKVAKLEGSILLLKEQSDGVKARLKENSNREKVAIALAGLMIPLGFEVADKQTAPGIALLFIGIFCATAGVFPKIMGLIFKDVKE